MNFWERTWTERNEALKLAFGDTYPPDTVISFSWRDRIRCPGACALPLPPVQASRDPLRHRRDDWLYLTVGLSQPLDHEQVDDERRSGKSYSSYGIELGFIVPSKCDWPANVLYGFLTQITDGMNIQWGNCIPFGFSKQSNGELISHTGYAHELGLEPIGSIRAALFWRFLFPDWEFITSVGKFMVLIATGITERELQLAKETTLLI